MSIESTILNNLKDKKTWVFCIKDMLIYGEYKNVAKAIERMTKKGDVKRIIQGIYYYPLKNELFCLDYPPEIDDIVNAISRNYNWEIRETGSTALYKLGLDNQIPQKFIYLSSGPYRIYTIGNRTIEFKNASQKNFKFSKKNSLIIQSLKELAKDNITSSVLSKMGLILNKEEKAILLDEMAFSPLWMHSYIKEIGGH